MDRLTGFTLIELMVTLAVLAILLGIGVPGFAAIVREHRAATVTNELAAAVLLARSEAVKRRASVVVCRRNTAGSTCASGADWAAGWLVAAGGTPIQVWDPPAGRPVLAGPNDGVTFRSNGLPATTAVFRIALAGCSGEQQRSVEVSATGRLSTGRVACP